MSLSVSVCTRVCMHICACDCAIRVFAPPQNTRLQRCGDGGSSDRLRSCWRGWRRGLGMACYVCVCVCDVFRSHGLVDKDSVEDREDVCTCINIHWHICLKMHQQLHWMPIQLLINLNIDVSVCKYPCPNLTVDQFIDRYVSMYLYMSQSDCWSIYSYLLIPIQLDQSMMRRTWRRPTRTHLCVSAYLSIHVYLCVSIYTCLSIYGEGQYM